MFDASKLIPGEVYPIRSGGKAEFIATFKGGCDNGTRLAFFRRYADGASSLFDTDSSGRQCSHEGESGLDVVSDDPVKEKLAVEIKSRYVVVKRADLVSGNYTHKEDAVDAARRDGSLGIAELPETLLVEPV